MGPIDRRRRLGAILGLGAAAVVAGVVALEWEPLMRFGREQWHLHRLRHGDEMVKKRAAVSLADLAAVRAIPDLLRVAAREEVVAIAESEAAAYNSSSSCMVLSAGFVLERNVFYQSLVGILWRNARDSLPRLVSAANAGEWKTRCIAIHLLGTLRGEELPGDAIAAIRRASRDADERIVGVARDVLEAKSLASEG